MSIYAGMRLRTRCPKCRSDSFELIETYEENVIFEIKGGVMPEKATDHHPGSIIGVYAKCGACEHRWKPRGAKSLTDLVVEGAVIRTELGDDNG